jgi:hypothetical protein
MLTNQRLTMLNKVLELEAYFNGYLCNKADQPLLNAIGRNLNSIKALIKKQL